MMITATELHNLADNLHRMAGRLEHYGGSMGDACSSASGTISGLPDDWGGPFATDVISASSAFYDEVSGADGHIVDIADAVSTLAAEAGDIAGELEALEWQRDNPPADPEQVMSHVNGVERQEGQQRARWDSALSRFDDRVGAPVAALRQVSGYDLTLPSNPARDPDYVSMVLGDLDASDIVKLAELLIEEGDVEGFRILANVIGYALEGLSPDETAELLNGIVLVSESRMSHHVLVMLLWSADRLPPEVLPYLLDGPGSLPFFDVPELRDFFQELYGDRSPAELQAALFQELLAVNPDAIPLILELIEDYRLDGSYTPWVSEALVNHFINHPDVLNQWVIWSAGGQGLEFQRLLDFIHDGVEDDSLRTLVEVYAAEQMLGVTDLDDPRWENFGIRLGELQARIADTGHSASINAGNVAYFLIHKTVGLAPGGEGWQLGLDVVRTVVTNYQGDSTYDNLTTEGQQDLDNYVLAMTALASSDPAVAAELGSLLDGGDEATQAIIDLQGQDGELHQRIERLSHTIETSFHNAQQQ